MWLCQEHQISRYDHCNKVYHIEKWAKNDEEQKTIAMKMQTKDLGENQNNKNDSNASDSE